MCAAAPRPESRKPLDPHPAAETYDSKSADFPGS